VTHSATVNHGGGLRKERERVWAHPCHHAQAAFAAFADAIPVAVELETAMERAPLVLPDLRNATREASFGTLDALAALAADGSLLLSVVHRGTGGPLRLAVELSDFDPAATAEARTLAADVPWAANTLEQPDAVAPVDTTLPVRDRRLELDLRPFSFVRLRLPRR
jgi:alpha-N-arabinofuranosidase